MFLEKKVQCCLAVCGSDKCCHSSLCLPRSQRLEYVCNVFRKYKNILFAKKKMFALEVFSNRVALWPDRFSQKVLKALQCLISEGVKVRKEKGDPHRQLKGQVPLRLSSSLMANLVGLSAQREPVHLNCSGANLAGCYFLHEKRTEPMEGGEKSVS